MTADAARAAAWECATAYLSRNSMGLRHGMTSAFVAAMANELVEELGTVRAEGFRAGRDAAVRVCDSLPLGGWAGPAVAVAHLRAKIAALEPDAGPLPQETK